MYYVQDKMKERVSIHLKIAMESFRHRYANNKLNFRTTTNFPPSNFAQLLLKFPVLVDTFPQRQFGIIAQGNRLKNVT